VNNQIIVVHRKKETEKIVQKLLHNT